MIGYLKANKVLIKVLLCVYPEQSYATEHVIVQLPKRQHFQGPESASAAFAQYC